MKNLHRSVEALQALWASRPERERQALGMGMALLVPLVFYLAIWAPLAARVHTLTRAVPRERIALVQMREEAQTLAGLKGRAGQAPSGTALLGLIEAQAQANGVAPQELSPQGAHRANLVFGTVPFDALLRFFAALQGHGVAVAQASLAPAGQGEVGGRVTVRALS